MYLPYVCRTGFTIKHRQEENVLLHKNEIWENGIPDSPSRFIIASCNLVALQAVN